MWENEVGEGFQHFIPGFLKKLQEDIDQNRISFKNLARETLRCELSTREASIIATAVLIDVGLVSSSKTTLIVEKSKIER